MAYYQTKEVIARAPVKTDLKEEDQIEIDPKLWSRRIENLDYQGGLSANEAINFLATSIGSS